jgi:vitamin B12 transporter
MEQVVVTASRVEQRIQDALPATTLITREDIDRSQAADLATLLRQSGGMELTQAGGIGTVAGVSLRGAESRHTLVLVDGVALNNLNFGMPALEHIALANVERIEVVRGNVSSLYGSAALGGVIQIFTREGTGGQGTSLSVQAGSRGLSQVQASTALTLASGTRLSLVAESLTDNGFNAIDQTKRPGTNPDTDGYRRRALSLGLAQDMGAGQIVLSLRESTGVTAYDSQFGPATQADESTSVLQAASVTFRYPVADSLALEAALTRNADRLSADTTAYPYFVNSLNEVASAGLRWTLLPGQHATAGVESNRQHIESDTTYNATSRQLDSVRVGYQGDAGSHLWQINARQDRYSDFGSASTWYAAYGYRLDSHWRLQASASTGFTAPTFNDLYYPYGGNPLLRPEQLRTQEAGVQYATQKADTRILWFSNRYTDLIGNDSSFTRVNVSEARNTGLELSTRTQWRGMQLRGGITLQDPLNVTSGKRLDLRAATLANLGLQAKLGVWDFGGALRYSAERTDGSKTLAAYSVLDLSATRALGPQWKLNSRIQNALDARYETLYGYNQAPLGVFVGVVWQPNR